MVGEVGGQRRNLPVAPLESEIRSDCPRGSDSQFGHLGISRVPEKGVEGSLALDFYLRNVWAGVNAPCPGLAAERLPRDGRRPARPARGSQQQALRGQRRRRLRPGLLLHPVRVVPRVPAAHGAGRLPLQLPDPVGRGPHPLRQSDPQLARRPRPGRVRPAVPAVPRNRGRAGRARALPAPRRAPAGGSGRRPVPPLRQGALPAVLGAARRQRAPAASLPHHGRRPPRWPTATPPSCR